MTATRPFTAIAAIVFLLVATAHLLRIIDGSQVTIGDNSVPLWVSWVALVVTGGLAVMLLREARR